MRQIEKYVIRAVAILLTIWCFFSCLTDKRRIDNLVKLYYTFWRLLSLRSFV